MAYPRGKASLDEHSIRHVRERAATVVITLRGERIAAPDAKIMSGWRIALRTVRLPGAG